MSEIVGILLAAGSSRRFGSDKLNHHTPENMPVAVQSCLNLLVGTNKVVAVIRPGAERLAELLKNTGATVLVCPDAEQGMGTSLSYGINFTSFAQGWVIALADMPWIQPETINKVADSIRTGAAISAPCWQGQRGHPVGFSSVFRNELIALSGDFGAKQVLKKYNDQVRVIQVDDPGILRDIDTPADLTEASP